MSIICKLRNKKEKNLIKLNKIPSVLNVNNGEKILIKIDNNKYYYDILKIKNIYFIKIFKKIYKVNCEIINYHPYFKKIINIIFKKL